MIAKFLQDGAIFWATIDPIGTMLIFAALAAGLAPRRRAWIAATAVGLAALLFAVLAVAGQAALELLDVRLPELLIATGLLLLLCAIQMLFTSPAWKKERGGPLRPVIVVSLVNPAAIVAVLALTNSAQFVPWVQMASGMILLCVLAATLVLLLLVERVRGWLGEEGSALLIRLASVALAVLATERLVRGVQLAMGC